ncbi:MAG: hypothetical protein WCD21_14900, partial [Streptomyces sp.]
TLGSTSWSGARTYTSPRRSGTRSALSVMSPTVTGSPAARTARTSARGRASWPGSRRSPAPRCSSGHHRLPLADRDELWTAVFGHLREQHLHPDALLEFVPGNDPALLTREGDRLRRTVARRSERPARPAGRPH